MVVKAGRSFGESGSSAPSQMPMPNDDKDDIKEIVSDHCSALPQA